MEKVSPIPAKESPKTSKKTAVQIKTSDLEKDHINTDCSNELSPTLNHISTLQESNVPKKVAEEQLFFKKTTTLEFGNTVCSFEFPIHVTANLIKGFFISLVNENDFEVIEQGVNHCLAISKEKLSLKSLLVKCLPWNFGGSNMAALRLIITSDKINSRKLAVFKILQEKENKAAKFLEALKSKANELVNSIKNIAVLEPEKLEQRFPNLMGFIQNENDSSSMDPFEDMNSRIVLPSTLESYSFYYFHKILTSESYNLGKRVSDFINDFAHNYRSIKESADLLPQPMESILSLVNEIINVLFSDFNYGKVETRQLMPFARKSVEKYIFSKLHRLMIDIYNEKYRQEDESYAKKIFELQQKPFLTLMKGLEIQRKFWLIDQEYLSGVEELVLCEKDSFSKPYESAINELSKLNFAQAPCEKLTVLLMSNSMMKTSVVDFHKGKLELNTMDDELPITIYVLSQVKVENLMAELSFVEDYVKFFQEYESELRLMTNLKVSIQYIINEWKF